MRRLHLPFILLLALLAGCRNSSDPLSRREIWKNTPPVISSSGDQQLFYLDSAFLEKFTKIPADTGFIRANLEKIDLTLNEELKLYGKFYKYRFYILDTLNSRGTVKELLLLEEYESDPPYGKHQAVILCIIRNNTVTGSCKLAGITTMPLFTDLTTSVIYRGNHICTRKVERSCSDNQTGSDGLPCKFYSTTENFLIDREHSTLIKLKK